MPLCSGIALADGVSEESDSVPAERGRGVKQYRLFAKIANQV